MSFSFKRIKFENNVGDSDKKIRYGVGIALLVISLFMGNVPFLLLGIVLVGSAYLGWCPVCSGFGINTCTSGEEKPSEQT